MTIKQHGKIFKMTKEELIEKGNDAVKKALEDALIILNSSGSVLSGNRAHNRLFFSPKLDCTEDDSAIIFDNEDDANGAIENVLFPQEPKEHYYAIKITKYNPYKDGEVINIQTDNDGVEGETRTFVNGGEMEDFGGDLMDNLIIGFDENSCKGKRCRRRGKEKSYDEES